MIQFFNDHFESILTFIAGLCTGGFISYKYTSSNKISKIDTGGGDFAGRDMHKKG